MKTITIIFSIFTLLLIATNACSQKNSSIKIPLQAGENQSVQFATWQIYKIYLRYDTILEEENQPNMELNFRLRFTDSNKQWNGRFIYFRDEEFAHRNTPPHAFQNYSIGLKVNEDDISLMVEKLRFGKVFYLDGLAVIGNLSIAIGDIWSKHSRGYPYMN
jgi:hypothetical protein